MKAIFILLALFPLLFSACVTTDVPHEEEVSESAPEIRVERFTIPDIIGKWYLVSEETNWILRPKRLFSIEFLSDGRAIINSDTNNDGLFDLEGHFETTWEKSYIVYSVTVENMYSTSEIISVGRVNYYRFPYGPEDSQLLMSEYKDELGNHIIQAYSRSGGNY